MENGKLEEDDAAHGDARHGLEKEQPGIERPDQLPIVAEPEIEKGVEGRLQLHFAGGNVDQRRRQQRPARHGQKADDRRRDHGHQAFVADHGVQCLDQAVVHAPAFLHGADKLHQHDDQEQFQGFSGADALPGAANRQFEVDGKQDDGEQADQKNSQGKIDLPTQQQDQQNDQQ